VTTSVSIILPAWNEQALIERCLRSLLAIDEPPIQIIVIAGGTDDTLAIARRLEGERVTVREQRPGQGKQRALREGLALATGEIIYLTDADCIVPADAFRFLISPIVEGRYDAATGGSLPLPDQLSNALVRYQWGKDRFWGDMQGPTTGGVLGRNCAIRRTTLDQLGAFDDDVSSGTDYHLSQRLRQAGIPIAWTGAWVYSEYPDDNLAYIRMWRRWIKNVLVQGVGARSYREVGSTCVGIGSSGALVGLPFVGLVVKRWVLVPWLALLVLVTWKRASAHQTVAERGVVPPIDQGIVRFPYFVLLDAAAAVSGLVAALIPSMRRSW
jgi:glycosyltransferase involved in cell wall biosynthesis